LPKLQVSLFGGLEARTETGAPAKFSTRKTALVFAYLALKAGSAEPRARLAALLWSDRGEDQARGSLRQSLFAIRRSLEDAGLQGLATTNETASLKAGDLCVDALDAQRIADSEQAADLRGLLDLYRGPLLEGWDGEDAAFDDWLRAERSRRERQILAALRRLVFLERDRGDEAAALTTAERVCEIDPVCEECHRAAMQIYMTQGARNEALRVFERLRAALDRDLGVEPEPETAALAARLKRPYSEPAQADVVAPETHPRAAPEGLNAAQDRAPARVPIERRYVAVLAAELQPPIDADESDAEQRHTLFSQFYSEATRIAGELGGLVERRSGSRLIVIFGAPLAHGNDCERAVRAALALQRQLPEGSAVLRAAISNGPVYAEPGATGAAPPVISGRTVDLAEALSQNAASGEILLSAAARDSLGPRAEAEALESATEASADEKAWRLVRFAHDFSTAFIGRSAEMAQLEAALDACLDYGRGRIVHIRGEPGIGKTRLAEEARRRAVARGFESHRALVLDFGGRTRRDPVRTIVRSMAGLEETDVSGEKPAAYAQHFVEGRPDTEAALIYNLLDLPPPPALRSILDAMDNEMRASGTRNAAAEIVAAQADMYPLFLLFEDLQWVDDGALRGLAEIGAVAASHPVVIVMTSRIEGDPLTSAWRTQTRGAPITTIDLGPMATFEVEALAEALGATDAEAVRSCIERAGGHPLFLEQLLRLSADCATEQNVPPSVQSIVQVRLDQIDATARAAVQAASVLGQRFAADSVAYLLESDAPDLTLPVAQGLVRPDAGAYLFSHALLRDAIYDTVLPRQRRAYHRRAAEWFEGRDLMLRAEHLERAEDEAAPAAFQAAAMQQLQAYRYERAQALAKRGLALARTPAELAGLRIVLGDIFHDLGQIPKAGEAYSAALKSADDDLQRSRALIGQASVKRMTDDLDGAFADIGQAEKLAERLADSREAIIEQARLHFLRGNLLFPRGETKRCLEAHEKSLALARRSGRADLEAAALGGIGDAQYLAGRMKSAYETLSACVEISRRGGYGRIEVANHAQLGCAVTHFWPQKDALAVLEAAEEAAARVAHQRAAINARAGQLWAMRELGMFERCVELALQTRAKIGNLGATRYDQSALLGLGVALGRLGEHKDAVARLGEATEIAEQTGPGFHGAELYAQLSYYAPDFKTSQAAMARAETILSEGCVGHGPLRAYPVLAATAMRWDEIEKAERYMELLRRFNQSEPVAYAQIYLELWRIAVAARRHGHVDDKAKEKLKQDANELHLFDTASRMDGLIARGGHPQPRS